MKTIRLSDLHGAFRDGYTDDDISRVLPDLARRLGHDVVCVWEYVDDYGPGGHSDVMVTDEHGDAFELPDGVHAVLAGDPDAPGEIAVPDVLARYPEPINVHRLHAWTSGNYAHEDRVAGCGSAVVA